VLLSAVETLKTYLKNNPARGLRWEELAPRLRYLFIRQCPGEQMTIYKGKMGTSIFAEMSSLERLIFWRSGEGLFEGGTAAEDKINSSRGENAPKLRIYVAKRSCRDNVLSAIDNSTEWWS
jgi:hypothetical protein